MGMSTFCFAGIGRLSSGVVKSWPISVSIEAISFGMSILLIFSLCCKTRRIGCQALDSFSTVDKAHIIAKDRLPSFDSFSTADG